MPNCFQLTRKTALESGPVKLVELDEEMANHFGDKAHEKLWYYHWYHTIGLSLACGQDFDKIYTGLVETLELLRAEKPTPCQREIDAQKRRIAICDWLSTNFTSDAFYQHK